MLRQETIGEFVSDRRTVVGIPVIYARKTIRSKTTPTDFYSVCVIRRSRILVTHNKIIRGEHSIIIYKPTYHGNQYVLRTRRKR